ncbi:MAG: hypothetical protein WC465_01065 [Patescibacteria group bacterium]
MEKQKPKMYVLAVDMGYGHQRAAYPFLNSSFSGIINVNQYQGISRREQESWQSGRYWYELISRFKSVPFLGKLAFGTMDYFQKIEPFYPRRDLSKNSQQQLWFYKDVRHGLGKNLMAELNKHPLPLLTTFFVAAYAAEYHGYKGRIYCVVCDADVARAWAPVDPKKSRIIYLAPNKRVKERLMLYGVKSSNVFVTGFPLPKENIGGRDQHIIKNDLKARLFDLDPRGIYRKKYAKLIEDYLCPVSEIKKNRHPLTITFAVGGAGAQRDLGVVILKRLQKFIHKNKLRLNLVAGSRNDVYTDFDRALKDCHLSNHPNARIIYATHKHDYFREFNKALRTTDILWTKPSELTFYCGLGIPIIMSEPVGYQERYNRDWLLAMGAGIDSQDPRYVDEWLFDWLDSGWLAEAAIQGFMDAPKLGTYNIENIILHDKITEIEDIHLL